MTIMCKMLDLLPKSYIANCVSGCWLSLFALLNTFPLPCFRFWPELSFDLCLQQQQTRVQNLIGEVNDVLSSICIKLRMKSSTLSRCLGFGKATNQPGLHAPLGIDC